MEELLWLDLLHSVPYLLVLSQRNRLFGTKDIVTFYPIDAPAILRPESNIASTSVEYLQLLTAVHLAVSRSISE